MHFLSPGSEESVWVCDAWLIVLIDTRCQLDDVSIYCKVSVGLVQGCEWHWRIFGEAPYGTSFFSDCHLRHTKPNPKTVHAVSPDTYSGPQSKQVLVGIPSPGQLWNHLDLPSLSSRHGQHSLARSPTSHDVLHFNSEPSLDDIQASVLLNVTDDHRHIK